MVVAKVTAANSVVTSANGRTLTPDALIETDRRIVIYKECVLEHTKVSDQAKVAWDRNQ